MTDLDLEGMRLPPAMIPPIACPKRPPRHRKGERFIMGPIPWAWIEKASQLPGKALALSMVLWQEAGRRKCRTLKLCLSHAGRAGDKGTSGAPSDPLLECGGTCFDSPETRLRA